MKLRSITLLLWMLSMAGGGLKPSAALAASSGQHPKGGTARFDFALAELLDAELCDRLGSVSTEAEIEWRVTEFLLDPRLEELISSAREHIEPYMLDSNRLKKEAQRRPEYAHLVDLGLLAFKTSIDLLAASEDIDVDRLHSAPTSIRELLYGPAVPGWIRVLLFDGLVASFSLSVLVEEKPGGESEELLVAATEKGFKNFIRLNIAVLQRLERTVPAEVQELDLQEIDADALDAEENERHEALARFFSGS